MSPTFIWRRNIPFSSLSAREIGWCPWISRTLTFRFWCIQLLAGISGVPVSRPLLWFVNGSSSLHPHHGPGLWIFRYLDDWLVLASTFPEIVRARDFLIWLCDQLGIRFNLTKSSLDPSQTMDYLGMTIRTSPLRVFPTLKRVQKLDFFLQDFLSA